VNRESRCWITACLVLGIALLGFNYAGHAEWHDIIWDTVRTEFSIDERLAQFGEQARARLAPHFAAAEVAFPPPEVSLLAFKDIRMVEVYARATEGRWRLIRRYPILAASGVAGPKLREGDNQVPEGTYAVTLLNPNSRFHVSLRLGYPNEFDREMARSEGRTNLGGDIMIHGRALSIGCLAMGDDAAEEFFTLAAAVGLEHVKVVISPTDFRTSAPTTAAGTLPAWTERLYRELASELAQYPPGS
jgi:hypothetical protein